MPRHCRSANAANRMIRRYSARYAAAKGGRELQSTNRRRARFHICFLCLVSTGSSFALPRCGCPHRPSSWERFCTEKNLEKRILAKPRLQSRRICLQATQFDAVRHARHLGLALGDRSADLPSALRSPGCFDFREAWPSCIVPYGYSLDSTTPYMLWPD